MVSCCENGGDQQVGSDVRKHLLCTSLNGFQVFLTVEDCFRAATAQFLLCCFSDSTGFPAAQTIELMVPELIF